MSIDQDLPTAHLGRYITFSDISRTSEVSVDTIMVWHKLIRAMGFEFGKKVRAVWNFSPHEFYQLNLAGAFSKAGHPVGVEQLRQIVEATTNHGRPLKPLFLKVQSSFAIIAVDAPAMWDATARMLARAEEDAVA